MWHQITNSYNLLQLFVIIGFHAVIPNESLIAKASSLGDGERQGCQGQHLPLHGSSPALAGL